MSDERKLTDAEIARALYEELADDAEMERVLAARRERRARVGGEDEGAAPGAHPELIAIVDEAAKRAGKDDGAGAKAGPPRGAKADVIALSDRRGPSEPAAGPRQRPLMARLFVYAAAAVIVLGVGVAVRRATRAEHEDIRADDDDPSLRAFMARRDARDACAAADWDGCRAKLDLAAGIDPASDRDPEVQAMRARIVGAARADAAPAADAGPHLDAEANHARDKGPPAPPRRVPRRPRPTDEAGMPIDGPESKGP